uniref:Uncharacterized protein n=1 Tax=Siphoviridae sp. ct7BG1 TaxID=2825349 RepID=A0A8S5U4J7_9CAUD|nr:MAG TPA: hypothetical protein [Siphoviridae sp. ct7BG1]
MVEHLQRICKRSGVRFLPLLLTRDGVPTCSGNGQELVSAKLACFSFLYILSI